MLQHNRTQSGTRKCLGSVKSPYVSCRLANTPRPWISKPAFGLPPGAESPLMGGGLGKWIVFLRKIVPPIVHFEYSVVNQGFTLTSLRMDAQISSHHTQRRSDGGGPQDVRHPTTASSLGTEKDLHTVRLSRTPLQMTRTNKQLIPHRLSNSLMHVELNHQLAELITAFIHAAGIQE